MLQTFDQTFKGKVIGLSVAERGFYNVELLSYSETK